MFKIGRAQSSSGGGAGGVGWQGPEERWQRIIGSESKTAFMGWKIRELGLCTLRLVAPYLAPFFMLGSQLLACHQRPAYHVQLDGSHVHAHEFHSIYQGSGLRVGGVGGGALPCVMKQNTLRRD